MKNNTLINNRLNSYLLQIILLIAFGSANIGCTKTMQVNKIPDQQLASEFSRIYIVRPSPIGFIGNKTNIYENNSIRGRIGSGAYLAWDAKPGDITLQAGNGFIKILAQPSKTYYIKLQPNFSSIRGDGFTLIPISQEEGTKQLVKLKQPKVKVVS